VKASVSSSRLQIFLVGAILVLVNLIGQSAFHRIDLTAEERYSLSDMTIQSLDSLDSPMTVKVFLGGEMPAEARRFADAVRTFLLELKVHAGSNLNFIFIDPTNNQELLGELRQRGIRPIAIRKQDGLEVTEKLIFPLMVINYKGKEKYVDLMAGAYFANGGQPDYSRAEQQLEYKFVSNLRRLFNIKPRLIGLLTGHNELRREQMKEFFAELIKFYNVMEVNVRKGDAIPNSAWHLPPDQQEKFKGKDGFDVLLIFQPDSAFTEREKYEIDQFIMRGGRVLWLYDKLYVEQKDLMHADHSISRIRKLNLDDLTLKYGFQVTEEIVQDIACFDIVLTENVDGRPMLRNFKWLYYPYVLTFPENPMTNELDAVLLRYTATVDTVASPGIKKTVLFTTSQFSRKVKGHIISLNELNDPPPPQAFQGEGKGRYPVGLLLEGRFESVFAGRTAPTDAQATTPPTAPFIAKAPIPTRMIVIADGKLALPHRLRPGMEVIPPGNKKLLMNAIDYLVGDNALTQVRAKDFKVRRLDTRLYKNRQLPWQLLNVALPVGLVVCYGALRFWLRRRRNAALQQSV
jgi:gliding-associated putative ABC transporter substrate-binding component GldG